MAEQSQTMLRRAKIVATAGPATDDGEVLRQMMLAGLDVVLEGLKKDNIRFSNELR